MTLSSAHRMGIHPGAWQHRRDLRVHRAGIDRDGDDGRARYRIDPPSMDGDGALLFGWGTVSVPGSQLLFVSEHARDVGTVPAAGQVYIYRVLSP